MSLSATLFGKDSLIFRAGNVLGLGIPGWLDRKFGVPDSAPTLGEIAQQTAKEGEPRPIIWGRVRPIGGNIIHCDKPIVKRKKQKSGKGGSSSTTTETIYRTYAIRICEGPVTGLIRAWRNNKLVYDARGNAWGAANNSVFLNRARIFLGSFSQMPSADLEAVWGVGMVSAYRGTCYMVMVAEDVTDMAGAVPQWLFEVERAEYLPLTSRPYRVEMEPEALGLEPTLRNMKLKRLLLEEGPESLGISVNLQSMELRDTYHSYTVPHEDLGLTSSLTSIELRTMLHSYTVTPIDQLGLTTELSSIELKVILQTYTVTPIDQLGLTASLTSISLGP